MISAALLQDPAFSESCQKKMGSYSYGIPNFLPFLFNDESRSKTPIMSSLLSSPQGTGPQRHLGHNRRHQWSLYRPRKPKQAVSIPGFEVLQSCCVVCLCGGGSLPSNAAFLPLEQDKT